MNTFFSNLSDNTIVIIKTLTYRIFGGGTTFLFTWFLTGKMKEAGAYTLAIMAIHMVEFWSHEKVWRWAERKYRNKI
jgi:uncharacterized membrane protein